MIVASLLISATVLTPGSELCARVERNFDRLEETKYQPDNVFLTMKQSWGWPGDTEGRTILALVLDAQLTGRQPKYLDEILRRFPSKLNARGYFGPVWPDAVNEQQISGMGWVLRGLCAHYRWKRDPQTLAWIRRIADNLFLPAADDFAAYPIDPEQRKKNVGGASGHTASRVGRWELSSDVGCYMIGIDGLVDARMTLGDAKYDAVIDRAIARYLQIDQVAIKAQAHATLTGIRALLRYGRRYLPEAEERFRRYRTGCMTETYANANWFTRFETFTEPCAIVDSYMVALQLWSLTDKTEYLELADRIYWNALCRAQRKNGGFGLETCPTVKKPELKVHNPEAHWCCTMRGAEGLSTVADYLVRTNGTVLTLAQYHNATVTVETPAGRVRFREETGYPFKGNVRVTILEAPKAELVFRFFAPSYVKPTEPVKNGFVERRGVFQVGDTVEFTFALREETLPAQSAANLGTGRVRRFRGPLLLGKVGTDETVWHRMSDEIWEKGSGARTVLQAGTAAPGGTVVPEAPGGVFFEKAAPTFVARSTPPKSFVLFDWYGRILEAGSWPSGGVLYLKPRPVGYYRLAFDGCRDVTFAVVPNPEKRVRDAASFVAVDAALSWCWRPSSIDCPWYGGQSYRLGLDLLAWCGVPHVRERMAWAHVEKSRGDRVWGHYLENARGLRERGMRVSGMFHDAPDWTHRIRKLPSDLVALRDYCAATVRTFGTCMEDWEFWNEPDIGFAPEGAWDFAACQKAAFLGCRAGDPKMVVAPAALCGGRRGDYDELIFSNGLAYYADVFNFHTYTSLSDYPAFHADLRAYLKRCGIDGLAVWLTECGTNQEGHSVDDGAHKGQKAASPDQEMVWAEFLPKSQIYQLFYGVSRTYTFVMAAYNEANGAKDWGIMRRNGTVKPAYSALSALAYEVGAARLEGSLTLADGRVQGFLFRQPDGSRTLAFWTRSPLEETSKILTEMPPLETTFAVPATGTYRLTDLCGQMTDVRAVDGRLALTATRYPAYLSGLRDEFAVARPSTPCGVVGARQPEADLDLSIVLRIDPNPDDFVLGDGKTRLEVRRADGRLRVTAWNLSDTPKRGRIEAADGLLAGLPEELEVPANGSVSCEARLAMTKVDGQLRLTGHFNGKRSTPLVARIFNEAQFRSQCRETALDVLKSANWKRNTSAPEYAAAYDAGERALRFDVSWPKPCDRWFYPVYRLSGGESSAGASMIEFEVKIAQNKMENDVGAAYVMFGEKGDSAVYCSYRAPRGDWEVRRVEIPKRLRQKGFDWFRLGCNPRGTQMTFWVRNVKLLSPADGVRPLPLTIPHISSPDQ